MPFWQRCAITLVLMLGASYLVGLLWSALFGFSLPSYVGGLIGGVVALPTWEFLKRVGPKDH